MQAVECFRTGVRLGSPFLKRIQTVLGGILTPAVGLREEGSGSLNRFGSWSFFNTSTIRAVLIAIKPNKDKIFRLCSRMVALAQSNNLDRVD